MELEATLHELLARRAQRRLEVFRADTAQWKSPKLDALSKPLCDLPTSLDDAKAVTSQRGFLCEQLRMASLTPLKRWHIQLQLLEMDDHAGSLDGDTEAVDNPQSPLERSLAAIQRDRACFDISFVASPSRVADLKETLFDSREDARRVCEALAFSSTRSGSTVRVVLFRVESDGGSIRARSSLFVPGLEQHVNRLIDNTDGARLLLEELWR